MINKIPQHSSKSRRSNDCKRFYVGVAKKFVWLILDDGMEHNYKKISFLFCFGNRIHTYEILNFEFGVHMLILKRIKLC